MISSLLRFFLSTVKLWITLVLLVSISVALYAIFYQWYIPHFVATYPVYLQYDVACNQLASSLQFQGEAVRTGKGLEDCQFAHYDLHCSRDYFFQRGQLYDFDLRLEMPDSYVNQNLGMFMIRLRLFDINDNQLFNIARPAIYPYYSMYVRIVKLFASTLFHLLGYFSESYLLKVDLIDRHAHKIELLPFNEVCRIRIEIETYKPIEIIPPSQLRITARLEGIKYWMYFWPITSFIFITCMIFSVLAFISSVIYICKLFSRKTNQYPEYAVAGVQDLPRLPPIIEPLAARLPQHRNDFDELN